MNNVTTLCLIHSQVRETSMNKWDCYLKGKSFKELDSLFLFEKQAQSVAFEHVHFQTKMLRKSKSLKYALLLVNEWAYLNP